MRTRVLTFAFLLAPLVIAACKTQPPLEPAHARGEAHAQHERDDDVARGEVPIEAARNRDPHAHPDVRAYVAGLSSAERVADLRIATVIEKLALPVDAEIGDLGCGPGLFALALAQAAPEGLVYASDIEPGQLDALRERVAAARVHNVLPILASPDDPYFPPGRLDVVFVADTWHHLRDRVAYGRDLQRALKPGGRLAILEYKAGSLPVGPPPEHKLRAGELDAELREAGFVRVESFDTHPHHDFQIWRVRQPWEKN